MNHAHDKATQKNDMGWQSRELRKWDQCSGVNKLRAAECTKCQYRSGQNNEGKTSNGGKNIILRYRVWKFTKHRLCI